MIGTGVIAVGSELAIVTLTNNDPIARVLSISIVTFLGGMIVGGTTKPNLGASWGLLFCLLIATWDRHVSETILVSNSLWLLAALSLSVVCTVSVEYVFGSRTPVEDLRLQFVQRYRSLATMYAACSEDTTTAKRHEAANKVSRLAVAGASGMLDIYHVIVDRNLPTKALPPDAQLRIMVLARLMDDSAAFGFKDELFSDPAVRVRCARLAAKCAELAAASDVPSEHQALKNDLPGTDLLSKIEDLVDVLAGAADPEGGLKGQEPIIVPTNKIPLVIHGAMRKPENVAFALKISLCATICYVFYHGVDWPGISTSVTTVMVTGLSTTAAMKQRLSFRLLGSITGGLLLGLGTIVFLFPLMDSITSLAILIGAVAFGIAWISGGTRFAAIGPNIAFAFYFVALVGSRASTELAPARDRLFGILLAILVMWIVFDWIWPVRTITVMQRVLASVLNGTAELVSMDPNRASAIWMNQEERLRRQIGSNLAILRGLDETVEYDLGANPGDQAETSDLIVQASLSAAALAWSQVLFLNDVEEGIEVADRVRLGLRNAIAADLASMASAIDPERGQPAPFLVDTTTLLDDGSDEYERAIVARYIDTRNLVSALLEGETSRRGVSLRPTGQRP
ncbi:FUSC family protein [Granulicella arctica]|uniref:Multidrug resistance protein MdtO n=1 Tax=Granulicella arctica TaxID=940613 RepID=A0A7Y9PH56_9BACT|nr:FUSC family protein [Granulicella arctica]NYF79038.1 multidrug resistance protein MdtO [Granulicella arctica]